MDGSTNGKLGHHEKIETLSWKQRIDHNSLLVEATAGVMKALIAFRSYKKYCVENRIGTNGELDLIENELAHCVHEIKKKGYVK